VFHKWRISFDGNVDLAQRETVKLRNFENRPTLVPCDRVFKAYFAHTASAARETAGELLPQQKADALAGRWSKGTPVDNPQIRNYLDGYITKFPGLFDPAKRREDVLYETKHAIDIGDKKPVKLPPRRYSPMQIEAIRQFVKSCSIIRKRKGPWASLMLLTSKKPSGSHIRPVINEKTIWRICTSYQKLNKKTIKNGHPLPNAIDQIQRAAGHNYYCFIDLKNGFWHIRIAEKNREKTAFTTPFGLYE
jgi:hypothetical protein